VLIATPGEKLREGDEISAVIAPDAHTAFAALFQTPPAAKLSA
jgi:hypothetical protein